ncbi:MAG: anaerobic ribonucleoside-triphosphate reductase activating protein [Candidatus Omnitrophota bacterium]
MKIAGLQKLSLVDYPGCLASIVFVQGCNFRCGYCQNPDLVTSDELFDFQEKEVFDYISSRKNMLEGLVITGGEPAIYEDLPDFIRRIKRTEIKVKLDTNGSNPGQLKSLIEERLLDYIALDIKTSFAKYSMVTDLADAASNVSESVRLVMASSVAYEFRTTCVPGIVCEEDIALIGELVKGAEKHYLQQFRPIVTFDKCFQDVKPYSKETLEKFQAILSDFVKTVELRGI